MAPYHIVLHDPQGGIEDVQVGVFANDDAAIDHAGWISHPHWIHVWQGVRLVASFPPRDEGPDR